MRELTSNCIRLLPTPCDLLTAPVISREAHCQQNDITGGKRQRWVRPPASIPFVLAKPAVITAYTAVEPIIATYVELRRVT